MNLQFINCPNAQIAFISEIDNQLITGVAPSPVTWFTGTPATTDYIMLRAGGGSSFVQLPSAPHQPLSWQSLQTFDAGITSSTVSTGLSSNTDLAGQLRMSNGTASYHFQKSYSTPPICTASDTTSIASVKVTVTQTALTLATTGLSDVVDYACFGRN
jgi:hypothetical protein